MRIFLLRFHSSWLSGADFELIRSKWAEQKLLEAERLELVAELNNILSPVVAGQVEAKIEAIMTRHGSSLRLSAQGSMPTRGSGMRPLAIHPTDFTDVRSQRPESERNVDLGASSS